MKHGFLLLFWISIHAPREGRDRTLTMNLLDTNTFQSTRPARGATIMGEGGLISKVISIHAPREGRDKELTRMTYADFISIHAPREGRD